MPSSNNHGMVGVGAAMTVGTLSRRTGLSVKLHRQYEDLGLIYTVGRSTGGYRLFDTEAMWCVGVITGLRSLGLTLAEITELNADYQGCPEEPVGPRLAAMLTEVRTRTRQQIAALQARLEKLDMFQAQHAGELACRTDFRDSDPRLGAIGT